MGIINPSRGHLEPASEHLLSEPAIVARLARATLGERTTVDWEGLGGELRSHPRPHRARHSRLREFQRAHPRDVFYLPNEARDQRKFNNGEGKAKFIVSQIERHDLRAGPLPDDDDPLARPIQHARSTAWMTAIAASINGRRVVFMNPEDVREAGLQQGQFVDLTSHFEGEERVARHFMVAPFAIPRGCTATYFPEANVLVPINSTADRSNTPTSKSVIISIAPSPDPKEALADLQAGAAEGMAHAMET